MAHFSMTHFNLKPESAGRGREAAAEKARGRTVGRLEPKFDLDTTRQWCVCQTPWNDGEDVCNYCGKSIPLVRASTPSVAEGDV
jgi:hypothetical protein